MGPRTMAAKVPWPRRATVLLGTTPLSPTQRRLFVAPAVHASLAPSSAPSHASARGPSHSQTRSNPPPPSCRARGGATDKCRVRGSDWWTRCFLDDAIWVASHCPPSSCTAPLAIRAWSCSSRGGHPVSHPQGTTATHHRIDRPTPHRSRGSAHLHLHHYPLPGIPRIGTPTAVLGCSVFVF